MIRRVLLLFIISLMLFGVSSASELEKRAPIQKGLMCISDDYFQRHEGTKVFSIPNGNFEDSSNKFPSGWYFPKGENITKKVVSLTELKQRILKPAEIARALNLTLGEYSYVFSKLETNQISSLWGHGGDEMGMFQLTTANDAIEGENYMRLTGSKNTLLRSPDFELTPNKIHFLSVWVRSNSDELPEGWFWFNVGLDKISIKDFKFPNTHGEWKRIGIYFRVPADITEAHWTLYFNGGENSYFDLDDVRIRTATDEEFTEAYQADRKKMPPNDIVTTQYHGKYLANTIAKLKGEAGIPGKPFLIWAVGSSWTNYQRELEGWREAIKKRFPNAPEIIYKKRVGSGCPYDYARGWVHSNVLAEQPDLIFSYTDGSPEALETMLKDIRKHSTADIIIPSLHLMKITKFTDKNINAPIYDQIRELCEKYNAQFVDNRREISRWLKKNNMVPADILDGWVHQSTLGRIIINENIAAHLVENPSPAYSYKKLEKQWLLTKAFKTKEKPFDFSDGWKIKNNHLFNTNNSETIEFEFTGNRIDICGLKTPNGGNLKILVDGIPTRQLSVFYSSFIEPAYTNVGQKRVYPRSSGSNHDTGPHGLELGENIVPQSWEIRMIDNEGNFEIKGEVTGDDGKGSNTERFVSNSGQIILDPATWRYPDANINGDSWQFEIYRSTEESVSFKLQPGESEAFSIPLVQNLSNGKHTLKIITEGETTINSFYVFTPMLTD